MRWAVPVPLHRELNVEQTLNVQRSRDPSSEVADGGDHAVGQRGGRDGAGRVAGVDAGLLDVLHHRADLHLAGAVPHRVDVHLGGVLQEAVHQHGALRGRAPLPAEGAEVGHLVHGGGEFVVVVDDGHGPAA